MKKIYILLPLLAMSLGLLGCNPEDTPTGVEINGPTSVRVDSSIKLTANVLPATVTNKEVFWEIADGGGAYISLDDQGNVGGLFVGTATVYARAKAKPTVFGTWTIQVTEKDYVAPSWPIEGLSEIFGSDLAQAIPEYEVEDYYLYDNSDYYEYPQALLEIYDKSEEDVELYKNRFNEDLFFIYEGAGGDHYYYTIYSKSFELIIYLSFSDDTLELEIHNIQEDYPTVAPWPYRSLSKILGEDTVNEVPEYEASYYKVRNLSNENPNGKASLDMQGMGPDDLEAYKDLFSLTSFDISEGSNNFTAAHKTKDIKIEVRYYSDIINMDISNEHYEVPKPVWPSAFLEDVFGAELASVIPVFEAKDYTTTDYTDFYGYPSAFVTFTGKTESDANACKNVFNLDEWQVYTETASQRHYSMYHKTLDLVVTIGSSSPTDLHYFINNVDDPFPG